LRSYERDWPAQRQTGSPWFQSHEHKEEDVRKLIAAAAIVAVVFVLGCQDTQKVTELQGQVDKMTQQITEMEGQVAKLTAERDSLSKLVTEMTGKKPAGTTKPPVKKSTGGRTPVPPTKK
jgi:outer membrane murein-binding lipoprotein Lpp